jgi:hypothetical protein
MKDDYSEFIGELACWDAYTRKEGQTWKQWLEMKKRANKKVVPPKKITIRLDAGVYWVRTPRSEKACNKTLGEKALANLQRLDKSDRTKRKENEEETQESRIGVGYDPEKGYMLYFCDDQDLENNAVMNWLLKDQDLVVRGGCMLIAKKKLVIRES